MCNRIVACFALTVFLVTGSVGGSRLTQTPKVEDTNTNTPNIIKPVPQLEEPLEIIEDKPVVKSSLLPEISPYKYISQEKWQKFLLYVANDGKWIKLNFFYKKGVQTQYFEAYKGEKLYQKGAISGAKGNNNFFPTQKQGNKPHNHLGLFNVRARSIKQRSFKYDCWMYWGLYYYGDHGFHAALKSGIKKLGRPDSHGCDRAFPKTAKNIFYWAAKDPVKILTVCELKKK